MINLPSEVTLEHDIRRDQHPNLVVNMSSIASVLTMSVAKTAASTAAAATPTDRATPQGGILEGSNPSKYDPSNPIFLFIIQVRSQSSRWETRVGRKYHKLCKPPFGIHGHRGYCQISSLRPQICHTLKENILIFSVNCFTATDLCANMCYRLE